MTALNGDNDSRTAGIEQIRQNPPRLMSMSEAAVYLGISTRLLRDLIRSKKIKAAKLGGRVILRLQDVDEAVERLANAYLPGGRAR